MARLYFNVPFLFISFTLWLKYRRRVCAQLLRVWEVRTLDVAIWWSSSVFGTQEVDGHRSTTQRKATRLNRYSHQLGASFFFPNFAFVLLFLRSLPLSTIIVASMRCSLLAGLSVFCLVLAVSIVVILLSHGKIHLLFDY